VKGVRDASRKLAGPEQFTFYRASVSSAIGLEVFLTEAVEIISLRPGEALKDLLTGRSLSSYIRPYENRR